MPTYEEYAAVTAGLVAEHFRGRHCPILFTEPGTTLINRYIDFVSKVVSIKEIRGKTFVELNCSKHNLGEICELKKLPITVIPREGISAVLWMVSLLATPAWSMMWFTEALQGNWLWAISSSSEMWAAIP